jgi:hypothetical protein
MNKNNDDYKVGRLRERSFELFGKVVKCCEMWKEERTSAT